ncbi:MAG: hypothetical protein SOW45_07705 [Prevotella sp.]|nr:hypothetical protein [Prevotella sp.]
MKLAVNGLDRSVKPDFLLSGNITGEEIRVPYYTEREYTFTGYKMVTTHDRKFNWVAFLMTGWQLHLYPIIGIASEFGNDPWFTTTENTKKVPTYDVKGGYWMNFPVETGFVYNFEVQGQNGKPAPTSVTLDITYDEVSYKDNKVYHYYLNPDGSEGTFIYDRYKYWWSMHWYEFFGDSGSPYSEPIPGFITLIPLQEKYKYLHPSEFTELFYEPVLYLPDFVSFAGINYPPYNVSSTIELSQSPLWNKKTERVTIPIVNGKGSYKAYEIKFPDEAGPSEPYDQYYKFFDYGMYLPFDMTLKYIKDIEIVAPSGGAYVPLTKVDKNLLQ